MDALKQLGQRDDRPFGAVPDTRFYFPASSTEAARQTILRAIRRAEGPVAVVAGTGLGKTMLCALVASDVQEQFDVVLLNGGQLSDRRSLLQSILFELGMVYDHLSEGELRLKLLDRLLPQPEVAPAGLCLLVDEASGLSASLLEELRLMTNFTRNNQPRVRLVLAGGPALEEMLTSPELEALNQRLAARCYLSPLGRQETVQYVQHQLAVAGVDASQVVATDALHAVYVGSEGIPRLVNQIMDHALYMAIERDQLPICTALIEEAWADLQQLPPPWSLNELPNRNQAAIVGFSSPTSQALAQETSATIIEFGTLDDEPAENDLVASRADDENSVTEHAAGQVAAPGEEQYAVSGQSGEDHQVADAHQATEFDAVAIETDGESRLAAWSVWENDPPAASAEENCVPVVTHDWRGLFGTDFEEELDIPLHAAEASTRQVEDCTKTVVPASAANTAAESSPSAIIEQEPFVDENREREAGDRSPENLLSDESIEISALVEPERIITQTFDLQSLLQGGEVDIQLHLPELSVDAAPLGHEEQQACGGAIDVTVLPTDSAEVQLQTAIEELVAQLNFSAFAVESLHDEQVHCSAESARRQQAVPEEDLPDVSEHGTRPTVAATLFDTSSATVDDDRDLLIVDAEVGFGAEPRMPPLAPTNTRTTAYAQLFARLRK
ncbi:MAG: hypothetical protein KatS3mg111_1003 [Pirellulaceae bacterium]|nr:MAG: hypothetical protein KatS3mg111_1003 [Pirellulaceae bacterium]